MKKPHTESLIPIYDRQELDELEKQKKKSNHLLLEKIKNCAVKILITMMWAFAIGFSFYIFRYLYLTAFTEEVSKISRMQDIIVNVSGWLLFVLSQAGFIKKNNKS